MRLRWRIIYSAVLIDYSIEPIAVGIWVRC
jgi:hypothetical protein